MPSEVRCAGFIQCFQPLGKYIEDRNDEDMKSVLDSLSLWRKKSSLANRLRYVFVKYPLPSLFNNTSDINALDEFTKKATGTRGRVMHFEVDKDIEDTFIQLRDGEESGAECARYARVLHIYFRYVILKLIGVDTSHSANTRIKYWLDKQI